MNAIAAVGAAGNDLVEENYLTLGIADSNVVIPDTGQQIAKLSQLVIMGGKKSTRAQAGMVMDIFNQGPGDGKAVVSTGAAPNFVQHQQAAAGGMVENIGSFSHFDHEG